MICMRCGVAAIEGMKFCANCGAPQSRQCEICKSQNPPDKPFCGVCGAPLGDRQAKQPPVSVPATAAERRQLTVMFVDLVGSTALGTRLDPEDFRLVINVFDHVVAGLITQFEGFVANYMGDGVLAYFGYPQAHEADVERAISAGLAVVKAVAGLNTAAGPTGTLSARVGIASGLVIVGRLVDSDASLESAAFGDTPNFAARLQSAAEPGTVVISDPTRSLAGGLFEYREFSPGILKGRPEGERVWIVLGRSTIDSRFEALHPRQFRLVGRTEEIELMRRRWEQAKSGEGRVVLICGDAGIGKSRLIAAFQQTVANTDLLRLRFSCSPLHQQSPLYPIIRQMERLANFQRGDSSEVRQDKLRHSLPDDASSEDVTHFADLLSIGDFERDRTAKKVSPRERKEMIFAAILHQFENLARLSPIVTIFEDVHWADPTTLDLLARLVDLAERLPILLVITSRHLDQFQIWSPRPHVTVCLLNGLDRRMAVALVTDIAGSQTLPDDVVERIVTHADGVPLFIEELTKAVLEKNLPRKDKSQSPVDLRFTSNAVPTSLQASLNGRLDLLPIGKEVAQTASVIGREFSFDLLQSLSEKSFAEIERSLAELVEAGLIIARGRAPDATYAFRHSLLRDAAYASLLRENRSIIHRRLAEMLAKDLALVDAAPPQLIAWHFAQAGEHDKAVNYYLKAADQATGRFALAEMVSHLRNGLDQLHHLPDSAERMSRELAVQVALGRALIDHLGSGNDEVRTIFEHAHELCMEMTNTDQMIRVHDGLINFHFTHSASKEMLHYANELFDIGQKTDNPQALLIAKRSRGFAHFLSGRFFEAREDMQSFLDIYKVKRDGPDVALTTRDPKVSVCTLLGICLTVMGYPESGSAASLEGVNHAEMLKHQVSLILGLRRACVQGMVQRNPQRVLDLVNGLIKITSEYETFKGARDSIIFRCWGQFHANRDTSLLDTMQACIEHFDATKHWAMLPFFMASTAELRGAAGDSTGAAALLDRASELIGKTGEEWCLPEIIRLQARFCSRNPAEAGALLQGALTNARRQGAKLWELRIATSLAELWRYQNNAAALGALAPVYNWFTEGSGTSDLISARTLLDELGLAH